MRRLATDWTGWETQTFDFPLTFIKVTRMSFYFFIIITDMESWTIWGWLVVEGYKSDLYAANVVIYDD